MAEVQLVCLSMTLVITSTEKIITRDGTSTSTYYDLHSSLALVPSLLELLFYTPSGSDNVERLRFLSYVETQHEVSLVFEEKPLTTFPAGALEFEPLRWKALQVASAGPGAFPSQLAVLTQLTTELAKHKISVFQISTYQSDYGELTRSVDATLILLQTDDWLCCSVGEGGGLGRGYWLSAELLLY